MTSFDWQNQLPPRIRRIGLAIEMDDGEIMQVYTYQAGDAGVVVDYHNDTDHFQHGSEHRTIITDSWLDIHITGLRRHLVRHYKPGSNFEEIEAPTRQIQPPPTTPEVTP